MSFLPPELYATLERSVPLACVDFVPVRESRAGSAEVGLILRDSPFGQVWCHLGGRIRHGETIAQAIQRHALDTLSIRVDIPEDPQPAWVYQWFPPEVAPVVDWAFGTDPRKHAIGLSFVTSLMGDPTPRNEALDFEFFSLDALPEPLWPGCEDLLGRMLSSSLS
ncbi:ADP-ribose pyrophosphatase YjhB (NUDIX family) [Microbacterium ginsengiterrae]|uniref:ADP-ribose pyrophosphatase YjhB (NUDIX family) n=1 Tax=Microbacterium ginsengiterrae TaxID=546115 RepID=A0A7W9FBQ1_9MICO|nr:DUF4916 domain-containing protein [Microbacterium ginsengiterrae]MBB5743395.1 ADP-ribose pyrophosphatase YjhB (NUDIX family) [Microbacterium ginsengiterrae]